MYATFKEQMSANNWAQAANCVQAYSHATGMLRYGPFV